MDNKKRQEKFLSRSMRFRNCKTATNRAGNTHLCLTVSDLRACYAALQAQGVHFQSELVTITAGPNQGGLVVYFFDPDGYTLELFQPALP